MIPGLVWLVAAASLAVEPETTLVFGGDLMLNGIAPKQRPLKSLAPTFRGADLALANLEIPLTTSKSATPRKSPEELKRRDQFVLKANPRHAQLIAESGIGLVSLANNHAMDYGPSGLAQMVAALEKYKISSAGAGVNAARARALAVVQARNGQRIGLLSALCFLTPQALRKCSPATLSDPGIHVLSFGGNINEDAKAKLARWIGAARAECDILVVAFHWGIERKTQPSAYQKALGRAAIDAGADVVWGHHPHVLQPVERRGKGLILYSTGNLVSPLPGRTALFSVRLQGRKLASVKALPVQISGGRAALIQPTGKKRPATPAR